MERFPEYTPDAEGLMKVLRRLRAPDGCPWDRKQTRSSFARCLAGEVAELMDAIESSNAENIREELGDVLMNIFFQVLIAEEQEEFDLSDVFQEIIAKIIRRHAHIFGDKHAETPEEVAKIWQEIKQQEHARDEKKASLLDGVSHSLSPLDRAEELQKKAAKAGFDWEDTAGVLAKVREECGEVAQALESGNEDAVADELGDLFFSAVNLARFRHRESSGDLLRRANRKFENRFQRMEELMRQSGESPENLTPGRWNELWSIAKKNA